MDIVCTYMVVDILRHLPPRSLAVSRCICTLWRATVDHHRLLRADLLPLSLDAVIYSHIEPSDTQLLCRPSTGRSVVTAILNDTDDSLPADCCNGLLLLENTCVFNPATRQSVRLPKFPSPCTMADCMTCCYDLECNKYLVYDPTVSPHYEVFLVAHISDGFPTDFRRDTTLNIHIIMDRYQRWSGHRRPTLSMSSRQKLVVGRKGSMCEREMPREPLLILQFINIYVMRICTTLPIGMEHSTFAVKKVLL
jgi:hypothetical protein